MNKLANVLSSDAFIPLNKVLLAHLQSIEMTAVLGYLIDKYKYFAQRKMVIVVDGKEYFYNTQEDIEQALYIPVKSQRKYRNDLIEAGLLETKLMGLPAKVYYSINFDNLGELLNSDLQDGSKVTLPVRQKRPNLIGQNGRQLNNSLLNNSGLNNKEEEATDEIDGKTAENHIPQVSDMIEYEIPQERLLVADQDVPYNLSQTAEVNKQQGIEEEPYGVWVNSKEATDYYEQQSRFHPNGRKEKEIEVLLSAQIASNNSSTKKKKREYTPEFEQMWSTYGNKNNKYESFVEYKQLSPEQQAKLIDFISMYVRVREVKFQKNLDRLIRQEDYESLYESIEQQLRQKPRTTAVVVTDNRAIYC